MPKKITRTVRNLPPYGPWLCTPDVLNGSGNAPYRGIILLCWTQFPYSFASPGRSSPTALEALCPQARSLYVHLNRKNLEARFVPGLLCCTYSAFRLPQRKICSFIAGVSSRICSIGRIGSAIPRRPSLGYEVIRVAKWNHPLRVRGSLSSSPPRPASPLRCGSTR